MVAPSVSSATGSSSGSPSPRSEGASTPPPSHAPAGACDGRRFLEALRAGSAWLDLSVEAVNALNVFPVPDGDTGTNMSLTMRAALREVAPTQAEPLGRLARTIADGALMGARGNSGVILSQILRGVARTLDGRGEIDAATLAAALDEGATTAYKGVMKPVEGTMLTVAREAAAAAQRAAERGLPIVETLEATIVEARASLERTPHLLPVLAEAGVVDAGGMGLLIILEGALRHVRGEPIDVGAQEIALAEHAHVPEGTYNYDTQFVIVGHDLNVEAIREFIASIGDSALVVGDSETVKVHVHCDNPAQALDYALGQGQLTEVVIENMQLQYEAFVRSQRAAAHAENPGPSAVAVREPALSGVRREPLPVGVIAVAAGDGLQRVFESLGASAVVPGGQTMNPSTEDLLRAIEGAPGEQIILLPNNGNVILAAQQAGKLSTKEVAVVPTRTVPQGIAALLAYNYQADLAENATLMEEGSREVTTIEITRAVRSAQVNGLAIREGQIIGLLNCDLRMAGEDAAEVVAGLLERAGVEDREIVTLYYGEDVSEEQAQQLADDIGARYADLEVEVVGGGQAHYHYIISVE